MGKEHHLTSAGLEKLQDELTKLKARRSVVAAKIKEAKAEGDLSENADYTSAREEQDYVLSRIAEIESILQNATVIADPKGNKTVDLGNKVELECDGKSVSYTVVGSLESDPTAGKISEESPIGQALLGSKVGDAVDIVIPGGKRTCKVTKIS